jgi:hypothetical protein
MDSANNTLYYNNYFYLLPGTYELNLTLSQLSSNLSANLNFQIYGKQLGKDDLNKTFHIVNGKNYVSFEFSISNVYMTRYLSVSALNITGQIRLNSIMIKQLT